MTMRPFRYIFAGLLMLLMALPAQGRTIVECVPAELPALASHHAKPCCSEAAKARPTPPGCCVVHTVPADPRAAIGDTVQIPDAVPLPETLSLIPPAPEVIHAVEATDSDLPRPGPDPSQGMSPRGPPTRG